MTIISTDIENTSNPFTRPVKRSVAPSASNVVLETLLDFILDASPDALPSSELDDLMVMFGDLEAIDRVSMNEGRHFSKKSSTGARSVARKFYKKNAPRIKAMQAKLKKNKAAAKKKDIMAKSDRAPVTKKKKKKYNTKSHEINEKKLRAGVKARVNELFEPVRYRVIREFTIADGVDANIYEELHYKFSVWTLHKRSGEKVMFKIDKKEIQDFIKLESEVTVEDFI